MLIYPIALDAIFNKLIMHNITPIIVGGFIRDSLLFLESKDIDIEVYGVSSFEILEEILEEFGKINIVGKSFGVCKLMFVGYDLDFSLPRMDNKISSGHRGFNVKTYYKLDFKTATSRRDFTINSIGYDVVSKKLLDPFYGIDDLKNKILRAVNLESFAQDPLRVLRAAQFCARFNLSIEYNLAITCKEMVSHALLAQLPKERVFEEFKKLLLKSQKPSIGFTLLREFGLEIYSNNLYVIDEIAKQLTTSSKRNLVLMLAGLYYKAAKDGLELILNRLTDEKELCRDVIKLVEVYNYISLVSLDMIDEYFIYKLATMINIEELLILSSSIYYANNPQTIYKSGELILKKAKKLGVFTNKLTPILQGRDLIKNGVKPSIEFSKILNDAYEEQLHGKFKTYDEAIVWLKRYLKL
ncbi:Polynucleotide adenylyltransferase region [Sulfurimonas denitrificans DSM 1251]|jgi:tRNA nucleotidyltransferase (CCA-adding enzyme)|uniref:Polynucleotide adenylyltransferase region n=1 Tax=Sulfurimonas denitrificans (strain ATCC 33889 / DSM 1251) TaxID=326298 RepID=Q30UP5_SULDN|nr:CCA tRNA nucleotidyltransferase [Sulfurimonas denitrificans]ABB43286.1 Polynucleotide adenylyltransferase region [Sulfurimonas denitrificans DSM 1251]MDD3442566.1 CCA tRNA nucleotidyltransferase [Sulfurimonas denitrificans]